jgi:hypothetical protein
MLLYLLIGLIIGALNAIRDYNAIASNFNRNEEVWFLVCIVWLIALNVILWPITLIETAIKLVIKLKGLQ